MRIRLIFCLFFVAIMVGSCDHDLDLTPETSLTSDNYYENEEQFKQALNASYSNLRDIAYIGIFMDEMRSDNTFFTFYDADRGTSQSVESFAEFRDDELSSTESNNPGDRYGGDFSAIAKTNTIIDQVDDDALDLSSGLKDSISSEALFLRSFYYYDLVTHYGGVPLQLEEVEDEEEAYKPRNSAGEVYDQIIEDLKTAIQNLPVAKSFPQSGRATKGAGKMLLAYTYMSRPDADEEDYINAEDALKDITDMHYDLLDNYEDNFDPDNKNNKESIFAVQYKEGEKDGQQSSFGWMFIPKTKNPEIFTGVEGTNLKGSLESGGWNVPTKEMVDSYETGDLRLNASIGVAVGNGNVESFETEEILSPEDFDSSNYDDEFHYFIRKYLHPPYETEWDQPENFPVFRYSGALLLLSENLVHQGKSGDALPYINEVRNRAGLPSLSSVDEEDVSNEMRHELAFENHRWTDLIRIGKAVEVLQAKGDRMKEIHSRLGSDAFDVNEDRLIYAIPERELEINDDLEQNPGY